MSGCPAELCPVRACAVYTDGLGRVERLQNFMAVFDYVVEDLKKTDSMIMVHSNSALESCSVLSIRCLLSFADIARGDPLTGAVGQLGVAGAGDGGVGGENVPVQRAAWQAQPRVGCGGG